ncbi:hypothetical protein GCM10008106_05020 [Mongoliitalea lutea]|uniref:Outer membrane protein beta-barrel domain-containing protein n=2 Tax=Mongoliitalea lutea TaxID=849756 RepID=A0A8J3CW35_9BACT|nr:hypothetical protein GCM10008106_05020 [Mongoliitalea lutea]
MILILLSSQSGFSQSETEDEKDSEKEKKESTKWGNLPYFMDDIKLVAGLNRGGVFWSDEFRNLSYGSGYQLGLEGFLPMGKISFFHYGMHYSARTFNHLNQVDFRTNHLDFPIFASFGLPEFTSIDFRFLLGTQLSARIGGRQIGTYSSLGNDQFLFDVNEFKSLDGGMFFGLSGEQKDFYFRVRSYIGVNNLDRRDLGSLNAFYIDFGYFLFRRYRQ